MRHTRAALLAFYPVLILVCGLYYCSLPPSPDQSSYDYEAFLEHERAKGELKALVPEDAKEAIGHGVRARRSKVGAVSFDLIDNEAAHAPVE